MAPNIPDHYLWLSLGVFTFFAIQHVSSGLRTVKSLTTVRRPPPQPLGIHTSTSQEDAIKTTSLLTLAQSPNIEIRTSATTLLCERFYANPSALKLLLRDLGSADKHVQRSAQLAFRLLRDYGMFRAHGLSYGFGGLEPQAGWENVEVFGGGRPRRSLRESERDAEEERDVRRRRREAVVVHDGEGRVGEGDVWMRDRDGVMNLDMEVGELVIDGVVQ
ncbi:hypothetical protein SVAN01_07107 [Stagonosporopsis vannaccii]|nr:hypothetical protein SVAN01_07107 [Stagonosporopsis vannaccii]